MRRECETELDFVKWGQRMVVFTSVCIVLIVLSRMLMHIRVTS